MCCSKVGGGGYDGINDRLVKACRYGAHIDTGRQVHQNTVPHTGKAQYTGPTEGQTTRDCTARGPQKRQGAIQPANREKQWQGKGRPVALADEGQAPGPVKVDGR